METKILTEDEFYDQFDPITGPDGEDWWGDFPVGVPVEQIWSVADGMGGYIAMSGRHVVNVFAYMVTRVPWTEDITVNFD